MSTLLLHFANGEGKNFLKTLQDEYDGINDALLERAASKDFVIVSDQISSRRKMINAITSYEKDILLFLFSGHAGPEQLSLIDGEGNSDGIAGLLGKCKNLGLVILNGCSTAAQVNALLNNGIPIVIATSAPVGDQTATQFSISFFKELSIGSSIRDAFNQSIIKARVYGKIEGVEIESRGLVTVEKNANVPLWGIYCNELKKDYLDNWRLPTNNPKPDQSGINKKILESLSGIAYDYEIENSKEKILSSLPFLISEPIRKLLTPKNGLGVFYDSPSKDRFKMLLFAYRAVINLATFTLLAQLWDEGVNNENRSIISSEGQELFTSTFCNNSQSKNHPSNLELLKFLLQVIKAEQLSCFIIDMEGILDTFNKADTKNALDDLESKLKKEDELAATSDLLTLCLETENSLAKILRAFDFMIEYSLTSIPNIEFFKNQRLNKQVFRYRFRTLRNQGDVLIEEDDRLFSKFPLDYYSVIIHKHGDRSTNGNLNLSPFLIDKNAHDNASKPDLHFLEYFSPVEKTLYYCPATSYKNLWEVSPEENRVPKKKRLSSPDQEDLNAPLTFNSLLYKQIESFTSIVLNKTPNEL